LFGQQVRGCLRAGHDVLGGHGEAEPVQLRGDLAGAAGGVIGDEQLGRLGPLQRVDRTGGGLVAAEHRPVQVDQ
jgi:hypothetical protein